MQKVGQILKEARFKKSLTLEDVEKETKIRQRILAALEKGDWNNLPPEPYVLGLVKNYGEYLGLPISWLLALFRREFKASNPQPKTIKSKGFFPWSGTKFEPNILLFWGIIFFVLASLLFLFIQYVLFAGVPNLEVFSPKDGIEISLPVVDISGRTDPDVQLFINEQKVDLAKDGSFTSQIKVLSPQTRLEIVAKGRLGREKKIVRTIRSAF
ncbi:hypothetical protein A2Z23_00315 [Candidatus Curtissbacteria bacterium RBG_16_39_7]|uniref:HTH cro/C1-type domain-containing protein n=1 Tax=Candidatus Curtissbacteria bacterium RBG_16_39_7 TaxID=1797707 RepID=A0A1F5G393_9BACT|nr:MAG: hypothetical protein A2Z23_00315 [Candidatus Curtissbacteria bacterium RBG_16_39_7]